MSGSHPKQLILHQSCGVVVFNSVSELICGIHKAGLTVHEFCRNLSPHGGRYYPHEWSGYRDEEGIFQIQRRTGVPESYPYILFDANGQNLGSSGLNALIYQWRQSKNDLPRRRKPRKCRHHSWRNINNYHRRLKQGEAVLEELEPPIRKKVRQRLDPDWDSPPDRATPKSWKHQSRRRAQWAR